MEVQSAKIHEMCVETPGTSSGPAILEGQLISKWSVDGTSGQSAYKQRSETAMQEECMLVTSMVPLRLTIADQPVWLNEKHSSTRFCRPLHLQCLRKRHPM